MDGTGGSLFYLQQTVEGNLWKVRREGCAELQGLVVVYVDDIMMLGPEGVMTQGFLSRLQSSWKCSTPEWCGFEIRRTAQGIHMGMGQGDYARELCERHACGSSRPISSGVKMTPAAPKATRGSNGLSVVLVDNRHRIFGRFQVFFDTIPGS